MVRGLAALYASTFFSGAWAMIIPTIPVLRQQFEVSAGAAAQIVTAFAIGKFVGTAIGGMILDRMGTRVALVGGPLGAGIASLSAAAAPWLSLILLFALDHGRGRQSLGNCPRNFRNRSRTTRSARAGHQ